MCMYYMNIYILNIYIDIICLDLINKYIHIYYYVIYTL